MLRFPIVVVVFALLPTIAFAQTETPSDPYAASRAVVRDIERVVTPNGVQENFVATLGGARQAVSVRGADRANPILIFVHGGPGAVEMPVAWSFQRPWEDFFTVVQWDQRGAGKSYSLNDPATIAPTMTLERYRDDAIELIDLLRTKYGKRKVFLLGHSWGSAVGLAVAAKRPDLLHAYIGMGQVIDFRENERVGFAWTLQQARARQDAEGIAALQALAPYPRPEPLEIAKSDAWRKYSVRYGALAAGRDNADFYFHAPRLSPEYTPADRKAWSDGSAFSVATLWSRLDKVSFAKLDRVATPVILLLGRHDYTVPAAIADAWMKRLSAPAKTTIWFENSAHLMMVEEPGRTLKALLDHARPLARD